MKYLKNNYFYFTKGERIGIYVLLTLTILFFLLPAIYKRYVLPPAQSVPNNAALLAALQQLTPDSANSNDADNNNGTYGYSDASDRYEQRTINTPLFYFDPNTLSVEGWVSLGVKEKTAIGIQNYIAKGGKFRQAADVKKIWGIRPQLMERLIPFVRIDEKFTTTAFQKRVYDTSRRLPHQKTVYEKRTYQPIAVNAADSAAFTDLPGIGPGYAGRIVRFRNRLGGFVSVDQVAETFGLPDSTFQSIKPYLKIDGSNIKKLNINLASAEELKAHPYIRWQLANVIVAYRAQHGNFSTVASLKKIMLITDDVFIKIAPYMFVD